MAIIRTYTRTIFPTNRQQVCTFKKGHFDDFGMLDKLAEMSQEDADKILQAKVDKWNKWSKGIAAVFTLNLD